MKIWIVLFFLVLIVGCSTASKLKKYKGKPIQAVVADLGNPTNIGAFTGDSLYFYRIESELKGAEINKGQTTLDPMITPSVTKTESLIFRVRKGIVVETKKEIEYTRR